MAVAGVQLDFNKIVMSIMLAVLLWVGNTVYNNSIQLAVLNSIVESATEDRFTSRDALLLDQRISSLEQSVQELRNKVR